MENFYEVPGWEGMYEIGDRGTVRSMDRLVERCDGVVMFIEGKDMSPQSRHPNHPQQGVIFYRNSEPTSMMIHRIAWRTFVQGEWEPKEGNL